MFSRRLIGRDVQDIKQKIDNLKKKNEIATKKIDFLIFFPLALMK
jgi:hypothetical protein